MNYYEQPGNVAARRSNAAVRNKWRRDSVDPEFLHDAPPAIADTPQPSEQQALGRLGLGSSSQSAMALDVWEPGADR